MPRIIAPGERKDLHLITPGTEMLHEIPVVDKAAGNRFKTPVDDQSDSQCRSRRKEAQAIWFSQTLTVTELTLDA